MNLFSEALNLRLPLFSAAIKIFNTVIVRSAYKYVLLTSTECYSKI